MTQKNVDIMSVASILGVAVMFGTRYALFGSWESMPFSEKLIVLSCFFGLVFAYFQFAFIRKIKVEGGLASTNQSGEDKTGEDLVPDIYNLIMNGAQTFLREEYTIAGIFCLIFGVVILGFITWGSKDWTIGLFTAIAFWTGAITSMGCGYLGMMIATYSNARTTLCAVRENGGYTGAFNTAFRGGAVMGYALCALGVLVLWILLTIYRQFFDQKGYGVMMDCVAGYGLGGSTVAMFGRVGGGIYTKAADVGADLVGKVVAGLEEDDIRNPATIADNVGDNVGDIAGMGADLFGSFAEATCASLVIAAASFCQNGDCGADSTEAEWETLLFPVAISASGIVVCGLCSFVATHIFTVKDQPGIERALKIQMTLTAILMLPVIYFLAGAMLPKEGFQLKRIYKGGDANAPVTPLAACICAVMGTAGGLIIGLVTEYFTSHTYVPVRELAVACKSGTAVNIIFGMALGYKSTIIPVFVLASAIYVSFIQADLYGIALAALGMLSTLATGLTIDGFGPISDNAGGIAEMAFHDRPIVRATTDALDSAGNTTAAIGKGFAIGSAALVSLALYGAFVVRCSQDSPDISTAVNILDPTTFAAGLIGAMVPYWFAALTMKSVGQAAGEMVEEVKRQFMQKDEKGLTILTYSKVLKPDYDSCITISTKSSLREMVAPGALVIGSPLFFGAVFGVRAVFGLLTGSLFSSVQLAISMSNSGGAWDNCKKYVKGGFAVLKDGSKDYDLHFDKSRTDKGSASYKISSDVHDAAVQGDTVGDPFKDTSGPALNIVMKLQAIVSLVFAQFFLVINDGHGLIGYLQK